MECNWGIGPSATPCAPTPRSVVPCAGAVTVVALQGLDCQARRFLAGHEHCTEGGTHAVATTHLCHLHASEDKTRNDLVGHVQHGILRGRHVHGVHAREACRQRADGLQALRTSGTHGSIMAGCSNDDLRLDDLRVHAGLRVVVLRDQGPICDHAADTDTCVRLTHEEVLDCHGIEELRVWSDERSTDDRAHEESGMLAHDIVALVIVGDVQLIEQRVPRLAHDHRAEELSADPATATRRHTLLDDGHFHIRVLRQFVCARETCRACTNDDDICLGMIHHVGEVPCRHLAADDRLPDGQERHLVEVCQLLVSVPQRVGRTGHGHRGQRRLAPDRQGSCNGQRVGGHAHGGTEALSTDRTESEHRCWKELTLTWTAS
mmetsp:Transcript_74254/g.212837  ORF Transcript_74254/g.212837 Transcript_74254/m.212837 type:complete len:376 (+) Transcript_74254:113-1240(+)